ncbi:nicotinate phosphoribosyltransferase [Philodulcilactobacillus myokoensis]|uniref:Nicotinate phosphoribosyltransferase n=1 Tax=Philodulcilactobacillus myokoensis TaxID=2929573 RepID=A0A9W6B0D2_9LACO|nr:nicotinate phosphoribosyltransferase [Philodulcilactobacillus myokoensis]GLB46338.1 nicotinate phosphoribosyltransferase [Philodulcilactobacillus myokoensis]
MPTRNKPDLTLHTDFYELNMMQTYISQGRQNQKAVFEMFFRKMPFGNGYAIFAGLQQVIDYIQNLRFTDSDIKYLESLHDFTPEFIDYLKHFKFRGTIRSAVEGDLVFNHEPILQIEGTLPECTLVETAILNMVNYSILIATKASRIRLAADDQPIMEFGSRRAQDVDAAIWGTRAAYIGGFDSTSNVLAGKKFGIPVAGTIAHSLIEAYGNEYEAFMAYASTHKNCIFLVDTFDTIHSGIPNAIKVAKKMGNKINFVGIRLDSGDMAYLSKKARKMLDDAGFPNAKITASNGLDEHLILSLKMQKARIDSWGVGTKLITAYDQPSLGGVYKLVAVEDPKTHQLRDSMKVSDNVEKITTPGLKQVWRITERKDGKSEGDYVTTIDEDPRKQDHVYMFHPQFTYINKTIDDFYAKPVLKTIFKDGKLVYHQPNIKDIRKHAQNSVSLLWPEYSRLMNPQTYPVDLSKKLWTRKQNLLKHIHDNVEKMQKNSNEE